MLEIGYALSSEEHSPNELVRNAGRAEEAGFAFGLISLRALLSWEVRNARFGGANVNALLQF